MKLKRRIIRSSCISYLNYSEYAFIHNGKARGLRGVQLPISNCDNIYQSKKICNK